MESLSLFSRSFSAIWVLLHHLTWQCKNKRQARTESLDRSSKHPRRPRGSQSGQVKRREKSFQAWAEEPLGTDSCWTISKWSKESWFLIGHKKCFVLLCPIGEEHPLSSFREFVHVGSLISRHNCPVCSPSFPNQKQRNYWWVKKRFRCYQQEQFNLHWENCFWRITMYRR